MLLMYPCIKMQKKFIEKENRFVTKILICDTLIVRCFSDLMPKPNSHRYSFFIDIIPIWNALYTPDVINSPSPMSFKARISALYF